MVASYETWLKWMRKRHDNNNLILPKSAHKEFVSHTEKVRQVSPEYVDQFCTEEAMLRMLGMELSDVSSETTNLLLAMDDATRRWDH